MTLAVVPTSPKLDRLQSYQRRGFRLVFYPTKSKAPCEKNWTGKRYELTDWQPDLNVGTVTGHEITPGRFLADVDFDWADGVALAKRLLPATGFGFGRASKPISHAFYTTPQPVVSKTFDDINGRPLVELRGTKKDGSLGLQTMLPPSIHPNGEVIELRQDGDIAQVDDLHRRVTLYAVACLLVKHLGQRQLVHDARLALAGFLLKCGLTDDEAVSVGEAVAEATGNDVMDVAPTVRTTAERLKNAESAVKGAPALAAAIGDDGPKIISQIAQWLDVNRDFITSRDGKTILANKPKNIRTALAKLGIELTFNGFSNRIYATRDGKTAYWTDAVRARTWLSVDEEFHFLPPAQLFDIVVADTARERTFHPVKQYLDSLTWDGVPRVDEWLIAYGQATPVDVDDDDMHVDRTDYLRAVSAIVLIAAVRRVRQPGCKYDELLVLESPQGFGKSTALQKLCPDPQWFSDDLPLHVKSDDVIEATGDKWIIEASELSGMRKAQIEHLKATLSRQKDGPVRLAYDRGVTEVPRQFIIIGTTNSHKYLHDKTGNRRFWPVRVGRFDIAALERDRDQLWAEAAHREAAGESIRLDPKLYERASQQQEHRELDDAWELELRDLIDTHSHYGKLECRKTTTELFDALNIPMPQRNGTNSERIATIMLSLGFEHRKARVRGVKGSPTIKRWCRAGTEPVLPELVHE